ncbi:hypothetical protein [uncultured Amphritea sp.]|uniref:hypothetical protein n=1 Tax=uncultured Amphritea sp. TaxID=981605 RepID=UPI0026120CE6|nr:hypothetical protein [uncultured Amphritea sp.]
MATWTPIIAAAPQAVNLPGSVNATGELDGVITTGDSYLDIGDGQNINTNGIEVNGFRTSTGGIDSKGTRYDG